MQQSMTRRENRVKRGAEPKVHEIRPHANG